MRVETNFFFFFFQVKDDIERAYAEMEVDITTRY
jgi:hypothetical protein